MSTTDDLEDVLSVGWGLLSRAMAYDANFKAEMEMRRK